MTNNTDIQKIASLSKNELESKEKGRTRLYLVRHGELTTSQEWRYVGHMDVELNETGVEQTRRLGTRLKGEEIDMIVSSDLKRTIQTAEIIGEILDLSPVYHNDFREINIGHWEGMTLDEIIDHFPEEFERRSMNIAEFRVAAGESFVDVRNRVIPCLMTYLEKNRGRNILIVAHGGVNRVILCHFLGLDLNQLVRIDQAYACLNIIDYFDQIPVVRLINETV